MKLKKDINLIKGMHEDDQLESTFGVWSFHV